MAQMTKEVDLSDTYLRDASEKIGKLKTRTDTLREKLEGMYELLTTALDTPAGHAVEYAAKDVIIEPVDNMAKVLDYVSGLLDEITQAQYYKKVFDGYEQLNDSVKI